MSDLSGKSIIVTGASQGIGRGMAQRFVADGARVIIADIADEQGERLAAELGSSALFVHVDVTDEAQVAGVVDLAVERFGRLDGMVNNAGILGARGHIADADLGEWLRTMDILLTSVMLGIKHAARIMVPQGSGSIVNTSSTAGVQGGLGAHAYTAAKHAVIGLTKSTAVELIRSGIRVNAICPGATVSSLTTVLVTGDASKTDEAAAYMAAKSPTGRAPMPEDIAGIAAYLMSDESWLMSGTALILDGTKEVLASAGLKYYGPDI